MQISMVARKVTVTAAEESEDVRCDITLTEGQVADWLYALRVQHETWQRKRTEIFLAHKAEGLR